ncbi:MAG: type II toxin-antitoxin system RelE/ParE family toxin [Cyclobacteriaceae bacterium]
MKQSHVIWTDESFSDLEVIFDFLAEKSLSAANKMVAKILSRTRQLEQFPESGSRLSLPQIDENKYRFLVEGNYKIVYSNYPGKVIINTIIDSRRNPELFKFQ